MSEFSSLATFRVDDEDFGDFSSLFNVLNQWFYKPDLQASRIVLGTIKSHYLKLGDPAWLFVVAPPSSGKTTVSIFSASNLPDVNSLSDFTENSLLSGFYGHQSPGLLEKLGYTDESENTYTTVGDCVILLKDFTTVLSMRREKRAAILSQLREIHDGEFKRHFGTGDTKVWRGKITIIAAVTPILDSHYSIFSTLGERFLQVRCHRPDSYQAGVWAIDQQGMEEKIRKMAGEKVREIFDRSINSPHPVPPQTKMRIASLAEVVALARTHIPRSGYGNREIEYVPEPEANTRIAKGLAAMARGIAALNRRRVVGEQDVQDIFRVGLDCIPRMRRLLLEKIFAGKDLESVRLPTTVRNRQLEDLEALEIIRKMPNGRWKLTKNILKLLDDADLDLG